jgi:hypothetical protein
MFDKTLGGQFVDYEDAYVNATGSLFASMFILMSGCVLFGIGLVTKENVGSDRYKKDKKKK